MHMPNISCGSSSAQICYALLAQLRAVHHGTILWWAPGPGGLLRVVTQLSYVTLAAGAVVLALQACQHYKK